MEYTTEKKKLGYIIKDNLQKILIALVSVAYVGQGLFAISYQEQSIIDIIGNIGESILVGIILSALFNVMGLKDGRKSEAFVSSLKAYGETKGKATPYLDKMDAWCDYKNAKELEAFKKEIIQNAGLKWKAYKVGYYDDYKKGLSKEQLKALDDAKKVKMVKLKTNELLSDLPKSKNPFSRSRFGESEQEYRSRGIITDAISKISIGLISGMYCLSPLITQDNMADMIANIVWNFVQIVMWIAFGILKYSNSVSFIVDEYRQSHIIQKTEYINEFIATMQNNAKAVEEFDDEQEINDFIRDYLALKTKEEKHDNQNEQKGVLD